MPFSDEESRALGTYFVKLRNETTTQFLELVKESSRPIESVLNFLKHMLQNIDQFEYIGSTAGSALVIPCFLPRCRNIRIALQHVRNELEVEQNVSTEDKGVLLMIAYSIGRLVIIPTVREDRAADFMHRSALQMHRGIKEGTRLPVSGISVTSTMRRLADPLFTSQWPCPCDQCRTSSPR